MPHTIDPTRALLEDLIACKSLSPDDAGCQDMVLERLQKLGFQHQFVNAEGVTNLWAWHGTGKPIVAFAGHTDVVPAGDEAQWQSSPWRATEQDGYLYGRGACDMKSGVASSVVALEAYVSQNPEHPGTVGILLTSDEETIATHGTKIVIEALQQQKITIDYALVTEPSSKRQLGDSISIGRRGSMNGHLKVTGKQGHIAYPDLAVNPIHIANRIIQDLTAVSWDKGNDHFPPTSFQLSNINAGTGALNIIPEDINIDFNFRFNTENTAEGLQNRVRDIVEKHSSDYKLTWQLSGNPFLSKTGKLLDIVQKHLTAITGKPADMTTGGGISDARFIAPSGAETIELGQLGSSLHQIDEHVKIADIPRLTELYIAIITDLLKA